jgi:hypothetical protein
VRTIVPKKTMNLWSIDSPFVSGYKKSLNEKLNVSPVSGRHSNGERRIEPVFT